MNYNLERFIIAHQDWYDIAKEELSNGKKESDYMWFIFPQLKDLGLSDKAKYYGIKDINEAKAYLQNPILSYHMEELLNILFTLNYSAYEIFGSPDDIKLKSCLTLFKRASPKNKIYCKVLNKLFNGCEDELTLQILGNQ